MDKKVKIIKISSLKREAKYIRKNNLKLKNQSDSLNYVANKHSYDNWQSLLNDSFIFSGKKDDVLNKDILFENILLSALKYEVEDIIIESNSSKCVVLFSMGDQLLLERKWNNNEGKFNSIIDYIEKNAVSSNDKSTYFNFSKNINNHNYYFGVKLKTLANSKKIQIKLINSNQKIYKLEELEFYHSSSAKKAIDENKGLTIIAGKGKTTTSIALMDYYSKKLILENKGKTINFKSSLRDMLRMTPNIVHIGKIKTTECAMNAINLVRRGIQVVAEIDADSKESALEKFCLLSQNKSDELKKMMLVIHQDLISNKCNYCSGEGCLNCFNIGKKGKSLRYDMFF